MSALWIIWSIFAISLLSTLVLLSGKGSFLVTGFNHKKAAERALYNETKVSRQAGVTMSVVTLAVLAMALYIAFRIIPAEQAGIIDSLKSEITAAALIFIVLVGASVGYTVSRGTNRYKK